MHVHKSDARSFRVAVVWVTILLFLLYFICILLRIVGNRLMVFLMIYSLLE